MPDYYKICTKCNKKKNISSFYPDKRKKSGKASICTACKRLYIKNYTMIRKEKFPEKFKEIAKKNRDSHREERRIYNKAWREKNIEKCRERARIYTAKKRKIPKHNLTHRIRAGVYKSIKKNKNGRKWESLVGYSLNELMAYIESRFKEGMNWNNMGKWHVDHIKPVSSFNFSKPEDGEFRECWALSNLQPLWAVENQRKYNKINKTF